MHGLLCKVIYYNALLKLEKKHVSGVMSHEIHVQKAKTRVCSGFVDLHERFFVMNRRIFTQPRVEILHAPQAERERCSGLGAN